MNALLYVAICNVSSMYMQVQVLKVTIIGLMSRVFANGLRDRDSIPGQIIPKTQKMVLDSALLNTQYHKIRIKGKVEQSRETSSILPIILV